MTKSIFQIFDFSPRNGSFYPNFTLFRPLFFSFMLISQLIGKNSKNALGHFFKIILRDYLPNFRSISWLWPEKTGQTLCFVRAKNVKKGQKWAKKVNFFTNMFKNQYHLVSCTSKGQHTKFEVIWSIGLGIIAI